MLKRLYDKSKLWFAIIWIIAYCVLMSLGDMLSDMLGVQKSVTLIVGLTLSAVLLAFLWRHDLLCEYGFRKPALPARSMLYYLPIAVMLTANLWFGVGLNYSVPESVLYVLSMLCVGFLEEVIFRGLLFEAMRRDNVKAAIIVSSLTFGIGHIINLINGSGADLVSNLLQLVYATAAGFMFVFIYYRSGSILVCIAAHGVFNALSAFANRSPSWQGAELLTALLLTAICACYALYLLRVRDPRRK